MPTWLLANGRPLDRDPVVQAKAAARWLYNCLADSRFKRFVQPVVVVPSWFVERFDMKSLGVWMLEPKALDTGGGRAATEVQRWTDPQRRRGDRSARGNSRVEPMAAQRGNHPVAHLRALEKRRVNLEVDLIGLEVRLQQPRFAVEIKSSDKTVDDWRELRGWCEFAARHRLQRRPLVTTLLRTGRGSDGQVEIDFVPTSLRCCTMARNLLRDSA
jgi:hypothetical protein